MEKVIKIKQSDIEKIVKNIVEQQNFDTDTETPESGEGVELTLGQSEDGTFYVLKNAKGSKPEVVAKTK